MNPLTQAAVLCNTAWHAVPVSVPVGRGVLKKEPADPLALFHLYESSFKNLITIRLKASACD